MSAQEVEQDWRRSPSSGLGSWPDGHVADSDGVINASGRRGGRSFQSGGAGKIEPRWS